MLLHNLSWNLARHAWDYSHSKEEIHNQVSSQGFKEQEYMDFHIIEFIKAWRESMEHNKIAAVIISNQLYSLRESADQLDDTWSLYSLPDHNLVYDGLQAWLEEEMVLKTLLATCCKGASINNKILKYLERDSKSSTFPLPREEGHTFFDRFSCFSSKGELVNIMSTMQEAFLWAERSRTNALLNQLLPHRLNDDALTKLHDFHLKDQVALDIVRGAKDACGKGAVILEYTYCPYTQIYIVYVINQDGEVAMRSCPIQDEDEIEQLVSEVLGLLREDDEDITASRPRVVEILKYLYFVFIETIIDFLEHVIEEDKLVIVPCEGLTELPFQLLLDDHGIYLFEKFILSITPSLRTIKYLNEQFITLQSYSLLEGPGASLVVGDRAYINDWDRLEASRKEVDLISSNFEEISISKLLGAKASVQNVLDWGRGPSSFNEQNFCQAFAHFATHGIVNKKYKKGALQLAPPQAKEWEDDLDSDEDKASDDSMKDDGNEKSKDMYAVAAQLLAEIGGVVKSRSHDGGSTSKDNDMLSSEDVIGCGYDWCVYMVILSACNTAKGKVLQEGVLNLPRAFLIAGVPCIIGSQWLIDDEQCPKLMEEFYEFMKQGRDIATSLGLAMRLMKKSNEEAFHKWGAFNVWGLPTIFLPKEFQYCSIDPFVHN